jgi:hypothetical protein
VGIQIASRKVELFSTRDSVRRNTVGPGHLSLMLTTSATGDLLSTTFVYPGNRDDISKIPTESFPPDSDKYLHTISKSAYVDEKIFQHWLCEFIRAVDKTRKKGTYALLILDGNSSRLNVQSLVTCAVN